MIDRCSQEAYDSRKAQNKNEHDQLSILNVFRKSSEPLTAREAFEIAVADGLSIDFNGVRSKITELCENEGLLEKYDKKHDPVSDKKVNRWRVKTESKKIITDFFLSQTA